MSWELTATILGIVTIIAGVILKIFKPVKTDDIKNLQDANNVLRGDIEGLNKKVNSNYNSQQLNDTNINNRVTSLEEDIKSLEETINDMNSDRRRDTEKLEGKLEKINELILRLLQDK